MKLFKNKSIVKNEPLAEVTRFAEEFIMLDSMRSKQFDYTVESFIYVDAMLAEASDAYSAHTIDIDKVNSLANLAGSYIFESIYRKFGGVYKWYDALDQPILVVGEPEFALAFLAIEKAKGRIINGSEDNIPFFIEGVLEKISAKNSALVV